MLFAGVVVINGNAIFRFQTISYLIDSFTSFLAVIKITGSNLFCYVGLRDKCTRF